MRKGEEKGERKVKYMVDRNALIGLDFLAMGGTISALGYLFAQSVPIASLGFALAIIGALMFLIVPESVPHDAYYSMLKDAISNVELILEESNLNKRAWFFPLGAGGTTGKSKALMRMEKERVKTEKEAHERLSQKSEIRAFVQFATISQQSGRSSKSQVMNGDGAMHQPLPPLLLLLPPPLLPSSKHEEGKEDSSSVTRRFIASYGATSGLLMVPPGAGIARLAGVTPDSDLEEALHSALVEFSDLCASVLAIEDEPQTVRSLDGREATSTKIRIMIKGARLASESPYFNACLGSPLSCVAACVVASLKQCQVMITEEKIDGPLIRTALSAVAPRLIREDDEDDFPSLV